MSVIGAVIVDTFREALSRKIFWGLFGLSAVMLLFLLFVLRIDVVEGTLATATLFDLRPSRKVDVTKLIQAAYSAIAGFFCTFGMLLAVFASAGLVPSLLEPGRVELLLAKPVTRAQLLLGRYCGNLLVVLLNTVFLVGTAWAVLGAKTGVWDTRFLAAIPVTMFLFAVLLGLVVLVGVSFDSAALSTMVAVAVGMISLVLAQVELAERLLSTEFSRQVWRALYQVFPRIWDLVRILVRHIQYEPGLGWQPFWTSAAFGLVCLMAGLFVFSRRDF